MITHKKSGFTLLEILITIGIISLLAGVIATAIVTTTRRESRDARRLEDLRTLQNGLELFFIKTARYPANLTELEPDYVSKIPTDPLGGSYSYIALGDNNVCTSYHLGANLETNNVALRSDADAPALTACGAGQTDFSGKDAVACGGASGADRCYDINPEYLAAAGVGGPPPPPPPPPGNGGAADEIAGTEGAAGEHFTFSSRGVTPVFIDADIVPRDVKVGDSQTLRVTVSDAAGVVDVRAITELDNSVKTISLVPQGGATYGCTECSWAVTWIVNDTSFREYTTKFTARNSLFQENSIELTWTDPCSFPVSGDSSLSALGGSCSMSETVDGVEQGNFTVSSGMTLTINSGQTFVWNSGYSIFISGGTIAKSSGGVIQKTNLWVPDGDGDGYTISTWRSNQSGQDSQPAGKIRRYLVAPDKTSDPNDADATVFQTLSCYRDADGDTVVSASSENVACGATCGTGTGCTVYQATAGTDCNDSNANIFQNVASLVTDADQDGYSIGTAATQCVGSSTAVSGRTYYKNASAAFTWLGSAQSLGSDCLDSAASVNPGVTAWFASSGANGFDYNCSGTDEKRWGLGSAGCGCNDSTPGTSGFASGPPACGVAGTFYNAACNTSGTCTSTKSTVTNYVDSTSSVTEECH